MLTIGSLFSGIGGLELGLEWAGLGPVLWQCEIDPFARSVLARHWPKAVRYEDVRAENDFPPVGLVCGGFPCQDISDAGPRVGISGSRSGLWGEMLRVVRALRPRFVVVENSSSLSLRGLDDVLGGLAESGYDAIWFALRASAVGAPHKRERLFVVAHADSERCDGITAPRLHVEGTSGDDADRRHRFPPGPGDADGWRAFAESGGAQPGLLRGADGVPFRVERTRALGNAVVPQCAEVVGHVVLELLRAGRGEK